MAVDHAREPVFGTIARFPMPVMLAIAMSAMTALASSQPVGGSQSDVVCYVGAEANARLDSALVLSDGSILVGGAADSLSWLPSDAKTIELAVPDFPDYPGRIAFLMRLSPDDCKLLEVYALPAAFADDIATIKTTSAPGEPTGDIYIAGRTAKEPALGRNTQGYFIARLDGNFVNAPVTKLLWTHLVPCGGAMLEDRLPWDVGPDGTVIYGTGVPYGTGWTAVEALGPDGSRAVVPKWRRHWIPNGNGGLDEFAGTADEAPRHPAYSAIVLKVNGRGDFRSWTEADWRDPVPDGNGGLNLGQWPFDAMFPGPFDPRTGETAKRNEDGRGWYGYRWGRNPTACVGSIATDRRDGSIYIGGSNQSRLPGGQPDFEPWVIAMDKDGAKKWWTRLYPESEGVSTPDQYVDGVAIDYSVPITNGYGSLVVLARCHGNNVNNLWDGSKLRFGSGKSFQPRFTGTNGNAHYGWLGRMTLADGTMMAATFIGERNEDATDGKPFKNPILRHWPDFSGWPNLNTTRIHSLAIDDGGRPIVTGVGRRVITTRNAFQAMPSPLDDPGKHGVWSEFARVYERDLADIRYSSILNGLWDWGTDKGGNSEVRLADAMPVQGGILVIGRAPAGKDGIVKGNDMPTRNVPSWGSATHSAPAGVFALLHFD